MTKQSLLELIKADRQRRFRKQQGTIVERSNAFWVRFYRDGEEGARVKVTEHLCDKSKEFPSADCRAVELLRDAHMVRVNTDQHKALSAPPTPLPKETAITIGAFWLTTYLPWAQNNLRGSTSRGYEKIWGQYLKAELETRSLSEYTTLDANEFLTKLAARLNRNSLAHVRSLMSGIFKHAKNTRGRNNKPLIIENPMHDVKVLVRVRDAGEMVAYSHEETMTILNALTRTDAKLFFALCAVLGMRPSEAAAVKWENINLDGGVLKVREAAPYGKLGELKTKKSKRDLKIIEPVRTYIEAWHSEMKEPKAGLLFTPDGSKPINHSDFAKRWVKPQAEKVCSRWNGCYSGRHGAATDLYNQDGDVRAAYQVLGNSLEVVMQTYVKPDTEQGATGLKKREQVFLKAMGIEANVGK